MKIKKYLISLIIYILTINLIFPYLLQATNVDTTTTNELTNAEITASDEESEVDVDEITNSIDIYAPSAILIEKETGDILYQKNAFNIMYPASTVKIMTAILVLENRSLDELVTVSASSISSVPYGYTLSGIQAGETLTIEDLLYAMLIPSGNDAANALAECVGGSIEEFANMMNEKAIQIGCENTNFTNPNGVHDENMYTTAYDLALIAKYAMNIDEFRTIVSTLTYTLPSTNVYPSADRVLTNSNHLINPTSSHYYEYAIGIKTGYTNAAQNCLVAGAMKDNDEFIVVILGSAESNLGNQAKFVDAQKLFEFGFTYYKDYKIKNEKDNNSIVAGLFNLETIMDITEGEENSQWGYFLYIIARTILIGIALLYVFHHLCCKIKRYKYNCKHAKYKYKWR